ncbi:MAG: HisA/HisF-related TIM barrel protein [Alphaproteobacteria bacterium]|nr:HisA/HisF-related TIM barrel protein [Alphaproteobacteria bacterium]
MLTLYPSLHIKEGTISHLTSSSSDLRQAVLVDPHPTERAQAFEANGFEWLHVVDLDAAFSESTVNVACIEDIIKSVKIPVQLSGGIHDMRTIEFWFERGAQNIVLTSAAQQNPDLVRKASAHFPGRISVRIDSIRGYAARTGWSKATSVKALDLALRVEDAGAASIIFADINRGGALSHVNLEATVDLAFALTIPVIAASGVDSLQDLAKLKAHCKAGISGLIMGHALYSGAIDAKEALKLARG